MAIPSPLERSNWAHSMLEKYAAWVPANLDRIRANARIISTNDDPKSWNQMFGLDIFCAEHVQEVKPFAINNSQDDVVYFRTLISREAGKKSSRLRNGIYGKSFPGIINKKRATTYVSRKAKKAVQEPVNTVYANAVSADPISASLDTSFSASQDSLESVIKSAKDAGATSFNINVTF
tara:strand:+ start:4812 stop:5345 length:534 start_codon:yes stop_codon:yes gene_type:complete